MSATDDIRHRIETRISQGEFLSSLLRFARDDSSQVQARFVEELAGIAAIVRGLLESNSLIQTHIYRPQSFWPDQHGQTIAFIDAGVANVDLPSAAPIGIRVASYIVKPGDETPAREKFNIELSLVDDLYSPQGHLFDDDFDDLAKLRDTARMTSETAAAYRLAKVEEVKTLILHGPLVNPVAPYGLNDFPPFGLEACRTFFDDPSWDKNETDRQFVAVYLELLQSLQQTKIPVVGVVERSVGREPVVIKNMLYKLQDEKLIKKDDVTELLHKVGAYGLNDSNLFDVVLRAGEYTTPIPVDRQGPQNKWPDGWKDVIRKYPKAMTTYLKPSNDVLPFRVEAFEDMPRLSEVIDLVLHTSRLLPTYGFPVGLDIVDKFAKVPEWMSRGIRGQHQVVLIKKALESGDPRVLTFAKRVLAAKGRDWLFRPQA